jgi:SAM-dependent methyltransferase
METEWFRTWFDTKYYHLLYSNRDEQEAQLFITALLAFLNISNNARVLDIACGKGRHAIGLNEKGFNVVGIDLSKNSIEEARKFETVDLKFHVRDIRNPFNCGQFDLALNLFTSFGYFETIDEHLTALLNTNRSLNQGGLFVFDYLNPEFVEANFQQSQELSIENVSFSISKKLIGKKIIKQIKVKDSINEFVFQECVQAFNFPELIQMVTSAGFEIRSTHGNYQLKPFSPDQPRIIIIAQKK